MRRPTFFAALLLAASAAGPAAAQMSYGKAPRPPRDPELPANAQYVEKPGAQVPLDLTFTDHDGKEVRLGDCVGGKPTLLVLAYYTCPKLCTEVLNGLTRELKALTRLGLVAGKDFNVVVVSINPKDAPSFAHMKRRSYLDEYDKRPDGEPGWWFLTASRGQGTDLVGAYTKVRALADAVGFGFAADNQKAYDAAAAEPDPLKKDRMLDAAVRKTKEYVHDSGVVVLTPGGRVNQYLLGLAPQNYTAEDVRKALPAASDGKYGNVTGAALLCFAYDSTDGHYKPVMAALALIAAPFPLLVGLIVYFAWRRAKREKVATPPPAANPAYVAAAPAGPDHETVY